MSYGIYRVADILCRRDGCDVDEAKDRIATAMHFMAEANYDPEACERIMAEELGLEPDYILDLL